MSASTSATASASAAPVAGPTTTFRYADSHLVFPIWKAIRELQQEQRPANLDTILQHLQQRHRHQHPQLLQQAPVVAQLARMADDGLLLLEKQEEKVDAEEAEADGRKPTAKAVEYLLPLSAVPATATADEQEREEEAGCWTGIRPLRSCCLPADRDAYCYECHQAGPVLSCAECPRVFHATCIRPAARLDVPLLRLREPVPEAVEKTWARAFDFPYSRAKTWVNMAPTAAAAAARDEPQAARLCVRCRLLKRSSVHLRPLTSVASLHRLLRYSFGAVSSWIAADTFSTQEARSVHIPEAYVALLQPVLMQRPRTAAAIHAAIQRHEYRSIAEYRVDVMDVVHCIGVLRGTACAEYEAAAYLQLDVHLDCEEMTRCQDCFRASSEQKRDPDWFVRPCVVPHQLVYAKVPGFSHWPAKVIRQVRKPDAPGVVAFDVRFFGADHSRSTVPERYVIAEGRPINNIKRTVALKKALAEMAEYKQQLANGVAARDSDGDERPFGVREPKAAAAASAATTTVAKSAGSAKKPRGRPKSATPKAIPAAAVATPKPKGATPKAPVAAGPASHKRKPPPTTPESPIMLAKRSSGIRIRRRTTTDADVDHQSPEPKRSRRKRRTSQYTCCSADEDDAQGPKPKRQRRSASQFSRRSNVADVGQSAKTAAAAASAAKSPAHEEPKRLRRSQRKASHYTGCSDDEVAAVQSAKAAVPKPAAQTNNNNNNSHGSIDSEPSHVVGDESDAGDADRVHLVNSSLSDVPMDVEDEELLVIVEAADKNGAVGDDKNNGHDEEAAEIVVVADVSADEVEVLPVDDEEEEDENVDEDDDDDGEDDDEDEQEVAAEPAEEELNFVDDASADSSPPQLDAEEPENDTQFMIARLRRRMDNCPPHFVSVALDALREQIELNERIKEHHFKQIAIVKRLQWCTVCLKKAIYYCCWRVSYCSATCQRENWKDKHEHSCKRTRDNRIAAAQAADAQAAAAKAAAAQAQAPEPDAASATP